MQQLLQEFRNKVHQDNFCFLIFDDLNNCKQTSLSNRHKLKVITITVTLSFDQYSLPSKRHGRFSCNEPMHGPSRQILVRVFWPVPLDFEQTVQFSHSLQPIRVNDTENKKRYTYIRHIDMHDFHAMNQNKVHRHTLEFLSVH